MSEAELTVWLLRYSLRVHQELGRSTEIVKRLLAEAEAEFDKYLKLSATGKYERT